MVHLRKADIEDIPTIRQLALEIWPVAYGEILPKDQLEYMLEWIYSPAALRKQMDSGHQFILAHDPQGEPAGFASFAPHADDVTVYHLHKIYVRPAWQGSHVGSTLLQWVTDLVKQQGARSLQLNVNRHNPAKHFYERKGFAVIRTEDIDIGSGYFMNDYVMERQL